MESRAVEYLRKTLQETMVKEIFGHFDNTKKDYFDLNVMYKDEQFCGMEVEFDEEGKAGGIEVTYQYIDAEDGLTYEETKNIWDLDLAELNIVYQEVVEE